MKYDISFIKNYIETILAVIGLFSILIKAYNFKDIIFKYKIHRRFRKFKGLDLDIVCPYLGCEKSINIVVEKIGNKYVYYRCKNCDSIFVREIEHIKQEYSEEYD